MRRARILAGFLRQRVIDWIKDYANGQTCAGCGGAMAAGVLAYCGGRLIGCSDDTLRVVATCEGCGHVAIAMPANGGRRGKIPSGRPL